MSILNLDMVIIIHCCFIRVNKTYIQNKIEREIAMIRIKIHEKYMLTSDNKQFILNKIKIAKETKRDKDRQIIYREGDELLFPFSFYPSLESAIKKIPDRILMTSDANSIKELIENYKSIVNKLLGINFDDLNKKDSKSKKIKSDSNIRKFTKK